VIFAVATAIDLHGRVQRSTAWALVAVDDAAIAHAFRNEHVEKHHAGRKGESEKSQVTPEKRVSGRIAGGPDHPTILECGSIAEMSDTVT
jgi:hypothetical protein